MIASMIRFRLPFCAFLFAVLLGDFTTQALASAEPGIPGLQLADEPKKPKAIIFYDEGGKQLSLKDFRGKLLLVNLWATWCVPCVKEMPALNRLQQSLGSDRFQVVAVNQDRNERAAKDFHVKMKLDQLAVFTDQDNVINKIWDIPGLPASFIIDENGRQIGRLFGATEWDSPNSIAYFKSLLPQASLPSRPTGM